MSGNRKIDWVIVTFFVLAYARAWSTLSVLNFVAVASGIESGFKLMEMAEAYGFESVPRGQV